MPYPNHGESRNSYVKRFMESSEAKRDFPTVRGRLGAAEGIYDDRHKRKSIKKITIKARKHK